MLLSVLIAGCAGSNFSSKDIWKKTKSTVRTAYFKTQRAVTNTLITIRKYQREHAYGRKNTGETETKNKEGTENTISLTTHPVETPHPEDRFPSRTPATVEENLRHGQDRQTAKEIMKNEAPKGMTLPQRTTMTLEELRQRILEIEQERIRSKNPAARRRLAAELKELERTLLTYQKEEDIIEEMAQLRYRLRKLQGDLLKIQETNR